MDNRAKLFRHFNKKPFLRITRGVILSLFYLVGPLFFLVWSVGMMAGDAMVHYQSLRITQPVNNSAFWSAAGEVIIKVDSQPKFSPQGEDAIWVYMDKNFVGVGPTVQLSQVVRGTHSIYAVIVDANGDLLIQSPTIQFTLHKPSVLLRPHNRDGAQRQSR